MNKEDSLNFLQECIDSIQTVSEEEKVNMKNIYNEMKNVEQENINEKVNKI